MEEIEPILSIFFQRLFRMESGRAPGADDNQLIAKNRGTVQSAQRAGVLGDHFQTIFLGERSPGVSIKNGKVSPQSIDNEKPGAMIHQFNGVVGGDEIPSPEKFRLGDGLNSWGLRSFEAKKTSFRKTITEDEEFLSQ